MTALRTTSKDSKHINGCVLFNTPIGVAEFGRKISFYLQGLVLPFKNFYATQAAKSLYGSEYFDSGPQAVEYLQYTISNIKTPLIWRTIKSVIIDAEDSSSYIRSLSIPYSFVAGDSDYVRHQYADVELEVIKGGHISPHESQDEVLNIIRKNI